MLLLQGRRLEEPTEVRTRVRELIGMSRMYVLINVTFSFYNKLFFCEQNASNPLIMRLFRTEKKKGKKFPKKFEQQVGVCVAAIFTSAAQSMTSTCKNKCVGSACGLFPVG